MRVVDAAESAVSGTQGSGRLSPWRERTMLFGLLIVVAAINGVEPRLVSSMKAGLPVALLSLFGVSAVIWFALYALLKLALAADCLDPVRRGDWLVMAGLLVASIFPIAIAASAAMVGAGLYLWLTTENGSPLRRVAIIVLALTGPLFWGPAVLALLGPEITRIETAVIASASGFRTMGNVFWAVDGQTRFVVAGACSSLANISLTLLFIATLTQLLDIPINARLVPVVVGGLAATIFVNCVRIASIGHFPQALDYLHNGGGQQLFSWASLLLMGTIVGAGLLRVAPRNV